MVEQGFEALAVITKTWESCMPEEVEQNQSSYNWDCGRGAIAKSLSVLLQQAWLTHMPSLVSFLFFVKLYIVI